MFRLFLGFARLPQDPLAEYAYATRTEIGRKPVKAWLRWLRRRPLPLGLRGERYAAKWLRKRSYKIVAGGARSRYGEIDLVAVDDETVVFVEVKTRQSDAMGDPAEAVDATKQRHIVRSALAFMKEHHLLEHQARFDVMALLWPEDAKWPAVKHVKNAFEPEDRGQFFV